MINTNLFESNFFDRDQTISVKTFSKSSNLFKHILDKLFSCDQRPLRHKKGVKIFFHFPVPENRKITFLSLLKLSVKVPEQLKVVWSYE